MASAQIQRPHVQDRPPAMPETIQFKRSFPKRGPSGAMLFLGAFAVMGYGWYWTIQSQTEWRELRREKIWARINLVPLLQAEVDRDNVRRMESLKQQEMDVMKDSYPDWKPMDLKAPVQGLGKRGVYDENQAEPVYYTSRYVAPSAVFIPNKERDLIPAQWWRGNTMFSKNPPYQDRADWKGKKDPIIE